MYTSLFGYGYLLVDIQLSINVLFGLGFIISGQVCSQSMSNCKSDMKHRGITH